MIRTSRTLAAICGAGLLFAPVANAQTVVEAWKSIEVPPPPALEPVTVEVGRTALLILDMYPSSCNATQRPSCVPTIPRIQKLLADARAHKMLVVYTAGPAEANGPVQPVEALAPLPGEPMVRAPADKWFGSNLETILAARGVQAVIVAGTSADAAVLYAATGASLRNMKAIIPVDGISSANRFAELYTVWHLKNTAATVSRNVVITRTDLISLK